MYNARKRAWWCAVQPFPRAMGRRGTPRKPNSRATSGPEIKKQCQKWHTKEAQMRTVQKKVIRILHMITAVAARKFFQIYPQKKAVTVTAKTGQFTAVKTGKGQLKRGTWQNKGYCSKISFIIRQNRQLFKNWDQFTGGERCCTGFDKRVNQFIVGKSSMTSPGERLE